MFTPEEITTHLGDSNRPKPVTYEIEDISDIEVTEEYQRVVNYVQLGSPVTLVVGAGGTGKSTLIRYLQATLKKKIVKLAYTGVASRNIGGQTINSFFQFPFHVLQRKDIKRRFQNQLYKQIGLLILDEAFMIRPDVMDAMDLFLRQNGPKSYEPFGGIQVLLMGDPFQLPPVINDDDDRALQFLNYQYKDKQAYWFHAHLLKTVPIQYVELTKVYRQSGAEFLKHLNNIRVGNDVRESISYFNQNCLDREFDDSGATTVTARNYTADRINEGKFNALEGDLEEYKGYIEGDFPKDEDKLPSPSELRIKKDTRVMFTKNDPGKRWFNGSVGIVEGFDDNSIQVRMLNTTTTHDVERVTWQNTKYKYNKETKEVETVVVGEYTQFPLRWGWAITIHKAQGSTLEDVIIDLNDGGAFATGQLYVALSRAKTLKGIHLRRPILYEDVKVCPAMQDFYNLVGKYESKKTFD